MSPIRLAILTFSLIPVAALLADEPAVELPKEGAWARYHVLVKSDGTESTAKLTLKLFGSEKDNTQRDCRWVEWEWKSEDFVQVEKYLVPEKALRESDRPLNEAVKMLVRNDDGEVMDLSSQNIKGPSYLLFFLPRSLKIAEKIDEPQMVDYQRGRLTMKLGYRIREKDSPRSTGNQPIERRDYAVWVHPDVPIGHVRLRVQGRTDGGDSTLDWTHDQYLEDFGFDAKSALPN